MTDYIVTPGHTAPTDDRLLPWDSRIVNPPFDFTAPVIFAVTSDHHVGSTVGLCCPEKVGLPDGGFFEPSPTQKWIWSCYEDFWAQVRTIRQAHAGHLFTVFNGDLFEGDHHHTAQIIAKHPEPASYVADRAYGALSPVRESRPDKVFVVRGTEAHVGPIGASEEKFAREIQAIPDTISTSRPIWSWWRLRLTVYGCTLDFMHHPGTYGTRPWTEAQGASRLANLVWTEHVRRGLKPPDVAVRSHVHNFGEGMSETTHAVITPAFQLKTSYAHKVVSEKITPIGGVVIIVYMDGSHIVKPITYSPEIVEWEPSPKTS